MIKTVSYSKMWLKLHGVRNLATLSSLYGAVLPAAPLGSPLLHPPSLVVAPFIEFILQIRAAAIIAFQFKQQINGFGYPWKDNCRGRDLVLLQRLAETHIMVYRHLVVNCCITTIPIATLQMCIVCQLEAILCRQLLKKRLFHYFTIMLIVLSLKTTLF